MRRTLPWPWVWAACAAAGFALGWLLFAGRHPGAQTFGRRESPVAGGSVSPHVLQGSSPRVVSAKDDELKIDSPILDEWNALVAHAGGLSPQTMPALYEAINEIEDDWRRRALRAALVEEWVLQDAPGAFVGAQKDALQVPERWMAHDPEAAVNAIMRQPASMQGGLALALLAQLVRTRPDLVARFANGSIATSDLSFSRSDESVVAAFAELAMKDRSQAQALIEQTKGHVRQEAVRGMARALGEADPTQALAWAEGLPSPNDQQIARAEVVKRWVQQDPFAAGDHLAKTRKETPPADQEASLEARIILLERRLGEAGDPLDQAVTLMAERDLPRTVQWLIDGAERGLPERLLTEPALKVALSDPAEAVALLDRVSDEDVRDQAFARLLEAEGPLRPEAWRDWLKDRPADTLHDALRARLAGTWAEVDPNAARQWVDSFPEGPLQESMQANLLAMLVEQGASGVDAAQRYFEGAPLSARPALAEILLDQDLDEVDPEQVAPLLKFITDAERHEGMIENLAEAWTKLDPQAAIAWSEQLERPEWRDAALAEVAQTWATTSPLEASEWAASLPLGEVRDSAAASIAQEIDDENPEEAFEWAGSIAQTDFRIAILAQVLARVRDRDPSLAERILNDSNMSDADAEAVVRRMNANDQEESQESSE